MVAQWTAAAPPDLLALHPANAPAVALFVACATQWRLAGLDALPVGLDYAGLRAAAAMMDLAMSPSLFRDVQIMEGAALGVLLQRRPGR